MFSQISIIAPTRKSPSKKPKRNKLKLYPGQDINGCVNKAWFLETLFRHLKMLVFAYIRSKFPPHFYEKGLASSPLHEFWLRGWRAEEGLRRNNENHEKMPFLCRNNGITKGYSYSFSPKAHPPLDSDAGRLWRESRPPKILGGVWVAECVTIFFRFCLLFLEKKWLQNCWSLVFFWQWFHSPHANLAEWWILLRSCSKEVR